MMDERAAAAFRGLHEATMYAENRRLQQLAARLATAMRDNDVAVVLDASLGIRNELPQVLAPEQNEVWRAFEDRVAVLIADPDAPETDAIAVALAEADQRRRDAEAAALRGDDVE